MHTACLGLCSATVERHHDQGSSSSSSWLGLADSFRDLFCYHHGRQHDGAQGRHGAGEAVVSLSPDLQAEKETDSGLGMGF